MTEMSMNRIGTIQNLHNPSVLSSNRQWVEKYRPKTLDDIASQQEAVALLKKSMQTGDLPHLLLYGPPGTGKTSTILALARELFGENAYKERILELNASDERGISVVREKIKSFAKTIANTPPFFKLIVLDEADSMTYDAQAALRRIIEVTSSNTRFCILCNYVHKIIEPLVSRCAKFRFRPVDINSGLNRLQYICKEENLSCSVEGLQFLLERTQGDLRKTINYLQNVKRFINEANPSLSTLKELTGVIPDKMVADFVTSAHSGPDTISVFVDSFIRSGYSVTQFLNQVWNSSYYMQIEEHISNHSTLTSMRKAMIAIKLLSVTKNIVYGADAHLQLMDFGCELNIILTQKSMKLDPIVYY